MKLIPNWKQAHRLWSVRIPMIGTAAGMLLDYLPDLKDYMPDHWYLGIFAASLLARLVAQPSANE